MNALIRTIFAVTVAGIMLIGARAPTISLAQPRTPCDQLAGRLVELWDRETEIRADIALAGDSFDLASAMDRFEAVLGDTDALLQRMDECSRSPVPSMAD